LKLEDRVQKIREKAIASGAPPVPKILQGVTKERIAKVLRMIDRESVDIIDVVFSLLDNERASWFTKAKSGLMFCHGASTAHIGCHVGILQRGKTKLDREGRDFWIKPMRDIGAIETVTMMRATRDFVPGHVVAKSSNSSYRLAADFVQLLRHQGPDLGRAVRAWISEDAVRKRLEIQAKAARLARDAADTKHSDLIAAACEIYVENFLQGFEILYVDDGDGDRISGDSRERLEKAGIKLLLEDAMPDVLLWNRKKDHFWVIEAVTSDGEVDLHKVNQVHRLVRRDKENAPVGFTTAYMTWKNAAARQGGLKNLAPGTWFWILEDASKHFRVESAL